MDRYIGVDAHASSCTLAVVSGSGKRIGTQVAGAVQQLPRAFVRCTGDELADAEEDMAPIAARARAEGWLYRDSATPHVASQARVVGGRAGSASAARRPTGGPAAAAARDR
jgi:hypothetical protein